MDIDFYDVILLVLGLFFGQIVAHIFIYKVLHPYVVVPYLKKRKMTVKVNSK
jgi:hypothetical protein